MITLNQAKQYLQFANSDYDNLLSDIVSFAIGHIENYVGRSLKFKTTKDIYQGTGRQFLPLNLTNLVSVSEVKIDGVVIDNTSYFIKNNMLFKKDLWDKSYVKNSFERQIDYNIEVTSTSGYNYPLINDSINTGNVPKELQYVALELVKKAFILSGTEQQLSSENGSHNQARFNNSYYEIKFTEDLPKDLKRILNKYKG